MSKLILGCGYLGRRVARAWLDQGQRVLAVSRRQDRCRELRALGIEPVLWDVTQPGPDPLPQADTVLYAIGLDRSSGHTMREVYVQGLASVLEWLPVPERFLYISSTSVYGQCDGSWVDESSPTEPQEESGCIALEAEAVLRARLPNAVILRFAGIYGPGRMLRQQAIEAGQPIRGSGDRWLNLIHVDDGARAILCAEQYARPGAVYNVSDGHPVTRRDFFSHLAATLHAPPPHFLAPDSSPPPPHEKSQRRIANERIVRECHFKPAYQSYRTGLATK